VGLPRTPADRAVGRGRHLVAGRSRHQRDQLPAPRHHRDRQCRATPARSCSSGAGASGWRSSAEVPPGYRLQRRSIPAPSTGPPRAGGRRSTSSSAPPVPAPAPWAFPAAASTTSAGTTSSPGCGQVRLPWTPISIKMRCCSLTSPHRAPSAHLERNSPPSKALPRSPYSPQRAPVCLPR
jgi:hypothetical protein